MFKTQSEQSTENFDQLVGKIRNSSNITLRDKGTLFEYMVKVYLKQAYPINFSHVWMLKEVPSWTGISHVDNGIDLVCQEANSKKFVGVQAKFYKESTKVTKKDVDSFIAGLGDPIYSYGIFVTSNDNFDKFAKRDLYNQSKDIIIKGLSDLRDANIDWSKFNEDHLDSNLKEDLRKSHKKLRDYQIKAVNRAIHHYRKCYQKGNSFYSRGQLIMAPGTGKTFTSLNIAEALQKDQNKKDFYVLYLVPSIQLLSQTLVSWYQDKHNDFEMLKFAVTSDYNATRFHRRSKPESAPVDIGYPATTNASTLKKNYIEANQESQNKNRRMFVVFSTYQSIDVIHDAQRKGFPSFDFTVCDEAHRTAGNFKNRTEEGFFTKILHNDFIHSKLRLFQTATPKIYGEHAKNQSIEHSVTLASMDDHHVYGTPFYTLNFGDAVEHHILTDYRVQVLAVDESYIERNTGDVLADKDNGIQLDSVSKIIGTWNAMQKRKSFSKKTFGKPMKRAIAFAQVIDNTRGKRSHDKVGSKQIRNGFNPTIKSLMKHTGGNYSKAYHVDIRHADGSMNDMEKKDMLDWLAAPVKKNHAKILSNVKFLSEGVDVPSLDAVIFFAPKQSQIEIIQAVGRVMRLFKGKKYGYIILPIAVPFGKDPKKVLDRNQTYKSVWQVLNALRSIDPRLYAEVNKLNFHNYRSPHIHRYGVGPRADNKPKVQQIMLPLWKNFYKAITDEIVKHVGNRSYLDDWSKDVAKIARRHINWIKVKLSNHNSSFSKEFNSYLISLRHNINNQISKQQAIEMIAEHLITKPVFETLFSNNNFVNNNPVSKAMEGIIHEMVKAGFQQEQSKLKPFYDSVKLRAKGIHDPNDKQNFLRVLYNNFFSKSFKATTSQLGIVFTPVPIVNFIVHSVDYALHKYFNKSIANKKVNILDPFVGTGTFITQTLYYLANLWKQGKITRNDILRNYFHELKCNEIVLLSYYIAAINIESVFNEIMHNKHYQAFKGIVLTDTFESTERDNVLDEGMFNGNNKRLVIEKKRPITAIISNPPYSAKPKSSNDKSKMKYPHIDNEITKTYVNTSSARRSGGTTAHDDYIRAFRWASDRIGSNGVIGFVTDASYIDSQALDGFRYSLYNEFNYLYIYNLRGNQRLVGDERRRGGAPVFGAIHGSGGSKSPIAISILIKDGSKNHKIFYHQVNDYMSRPEKLNSIKNKCIKDINWTKISPDKNNDWIDKKDPNYIKFIPLHSNKGVSIFGFNTHGIITSRDSWAYGFSKNNVAKNMSTMIHHYNNERIRFLKDPNSYKEIDDGSYIKWNPSLRKYLRNNDTIKFNKKHICISMRRPFVKKWLYFDKKMNENIGKYYNNWGKNNINIITSGRGSQRGISVFCTNVIPDRGIISNSQTFFRYNNSNNNNNLLIKFNRNNINPKFVNKLHLSNTDAFYYIYGILSSSEYRAKYKNNLQKDIARIPLVKNVKPFVDIGKKLMWLHIHYEDVKPYNGVTIQYNSKAPNFNVIKSIKHGRYNSNKYSSKFNDPKYQNLKYTGRKNDDLTTIKFNPDIIIKNIPLKAYNYVINGKAAIDWILDQYRVKKDKKSGIIDDPNKFSKDPKYIFKLLLKVINVSLKTVDLVNKLPKMQIIDYDWRTH